MVPRVAETVLMAAVMAASDVVASATVLRSPDSDRPEA